MRQFNFQVHLSGSMYESSLLRKIGLRCYMKRGIDLYHLKCIYIANGNDAQSAAESPHDAVMLMMNIKLTASESDLEKETIPFLPLQFQAVALPLPLLPFRAHYTLNSNMFHCGALISGYVLYANTVSHHSVLLGSVSRVGLMVRCFKNSLTVRTENNSSPLHNLLTILWASSELPAAFYTDVCMSLRESSHGNKHDLQPRIRDTNHVNALGGFTVP